MCSWRFLYNSEFAVVDNFLLIRFWPDDNGRPAYMSPVGEGDFASAIRLLTDDALSFGHPLWISGVTPEAKLLLENDFPGGFRYIPERNYFDYIYLHDDLVNLTGKKYQSKRNHINKFKNMYPMYEYMPITPELVPECLRLECKWYRANRTNDDAEELSYERRSLTFALQHAEELDLEGGAICVGGEIVAFTFGSPINANTFGVHVEKGDINYDGVYSLITNEFSTRLPEQYIYINREEDLGIPGLRKSKLSYHPAILLEKNTAIKKKFISPE
jgi:hypothetical protein